MTREKCLERCHKMVADGMERRYSYNSCLGGVTAPQDETVNGYAGNGETMNREAVFAKLNEVFRDVFDDDSITVTDATTADDIEEWDSLEHINLLAAVEQEFGIKFNMGQVVAMKNVGEMADIILGQLDA